MNQLIGAFRRAAYNAFLAAGVEVHRKRESLRFLSLRNIRTVLDIGANEGQFARRARVLFPDAKIYSFEPVPDVFRILQRIERSDRFFTAVNCGFGEQEGEIDFEANAFTASSSALAISQKGLEAFPYTANTRKIRVRMSTLDRWAEGQRLDTPMLIKMDVQGFEDRVIRGGERTIAAAEAVLAEVSFVRLYESQPLFDEIYGTMCSLGFRPAGMIENTCDPRTGEILQADAIFVPRRVTACVVND